jgi:hypothetical protein
VPLRCRVRSAGPQGRWRFARQPWVSHPWYLLLCSPRRCQLLKGLRASGASLSAGATPAALSGRAAPARSETRRRGHPFPLREGAGVGLPARPPLLIGHDLPPLRAPTPKTRPISTLDNFAYNKMTETIITEIYHACYTDKCDSIDALRAAENVRTLAYPGVSRRTLAAFMWI